MNGNVFDVFGIPVETIPDNAVLQWDGCNWVFVELAANTLTCDDIWDCVDTHVGFTTIINNIRAGINGRLECGDLAACPEIINIWAAIAALPTVEWFLSTTADAVLHTVANSSTVTMAGLGGMRVLQGVPGTVTVGLPGGALDGQCLVRNDAGGFAEWGDILGPGGTLCQQVSQCATIIALQNQINFLLGLDPDTQPVLNCDDVANCIRSGATDSGTAVLTLLTDYFSGAGANLDAAMEAWFTGLAVWTNLVADVAANTAATAANLVSINTNVVDIAALDARIVVLEAIVPVSVNADLTVITATLGNLTFNDAQFDLVETSPGVVSIDIDATAIVGGVVDCAFIVAAVTGCGPFDTYIDGLITAHNTAPIGIQEIIEAAKLNVASPVGVPGDLTIVEAQVLRQDVMEVTFSAADNAILPELSADASLIGRQIVLVPLAFAPTITTAVGASLTGATTTVIGTAAIFIVTAVGVGTTEYIRLV